MSRNIRPSVSPRPEVAGIADRHGRTTLARHDAGSARGRQAALRRSSVRRSASALLSAAVAAVLALTPMALAAEEPGEPDVRDRPPATSQPRADDRRLRAVDGELRSLDRRLETWDRDRLRMPDPNPGVGRRDRLNDPLAEGLDHERRSLQQRQRWLEQDARREPYRRRTEGSRSGTR